MVLQRQTQFDDRRDMNQMASVFAIASAFLLNACATVAAPPGTLSQPWQDAGPLRPIFLEDGEITDPAVRGVWQSRGYGRLLRRFFHPVQDFIEKEGEHAEMMEYVMPLAKAFMKLQQATATVAQKGLKNPDEAGAASTDYLRQFALVAMGYMWARMAKISLEALDKEPENKEF